MIQYLLLYCNYPLFTALLQWSTIYCCTAMIHYLLLHCNDPLFTAVLQWSTFYCCTAMIHSVQIWSVQGPSSLLEGRQGEERVWHQGDHTLSVWHQGDQTLIFWHQGDHTMSVWHKRDHNLSVWHQGDHTLSVWNYEFFSLWQQGDHTMSLLFMTTVIPHSEFLTPGRLHSECLTLMETTLWESKTKETTLWVFAPGVWLEFFQLSLLYW